VLGEARLGYGHLALITKLTTSPQHGWDSHWDDHYATTPELDLKVMTQETSDDEDGFMRMTKTLESAFRYKGKVRLDEERRMEDWSEATAAYRPPI